MQSEPLVLRQRLIEAVDDTYHVVDFATIVQVLETLESLPVTKEVLETTRLGRTVNEFRRKVNNEHLAKRAKALVKKWRNEVLPEEPPNLATAPNCTAHFNGNSHLVSEGPGPGPGVDVIPIVKEEPESEVQVQVQADVPILQTEQEPERKKGRGRTKKKKVTVHERLAEKDAEILEQFIKAGLAKPDIPLPSIQPIVPEKKRLISGDELQSVSSPDTTTSGAPSGPQPSPSVVIAPATPVTPADEIVKNEIIEKYLKSQSELRSQMEQQYQDRLARNEFEEVPMEQENEDDEASRSSALLASTVGSPEGDTIDAATIDNNNPSTSSIKNGTGGAPIKNKKKTRLKDSGNEEPIIQTFEAEADILAKLPPIDPEVLSAYSNYVFEPQPEFQPSSSISTFSALNTNNNNIIETENKCLASLVPALTKKSTSSPFTPLINNSIITKNNISSTPTVISSHLTSKNSPLGRRVFKKVTKMKKEKQPAQKSIFDLSDDEEDDEDENDYEMIEEIEDEALLQEMPVPMEVDEPSLGNSVLPSSTSPHLLQHHDIIQPNISKLTNNGGFNLSDDSGNLNSISNNNLILTSNNQISQDVVDSSSSSCKVLQEEEEKSQPIEKEKEPQFVSTIEDSEVESFLTEQIVGLNGNYDKTGSFREFHETILVESYLNDEFHILPYTIIDF